MALLASIDASLSKSGILSVAGVSFGVDRAARGNTKWKRLMDDRVFHMTDLNARRGSFEGLSPEEVTSIMHGIVALVRDYASHVVAVSCDVSAISETLPKLRNNSVQTDRLLGSAFRLPYGLMLHLCMYAMGRFANVRSLGRCSISYVLESGDEGQAAFASYINQLLEQPEFRMHERYSLSRLAIKTKGEMPSILHAADLVAWEWGRDVERRRREQPTRKSFLAVANQERSVPDYFGLTLSDRSRHFFRHYEERHVDRLVRFVRELASSATSQDVDKALGEWAKTRFPEAG
jgi:hypothetical protein